MMGRYSDRRSMGRSRVVPYQQGEDARDRHWRRLRENQKAVDDLQGWCERAGITLLIYNEGQHWHFTLPDQQQVEWWPSSAKCVLNKNWQAGLHVHDHEQMRRFLKTRLTRPRGRREAT